MELLLALNVKTPMPHFRPICTAIVLFTLVWTTLTALAAEHRPAEPTEAKRPPIRVVVIGPDHPIDRLRKLGFDVRMAHWKTVEPNELEGVDVLYLSTDWAYTAAQLEQLNSKANQFHAFVKRGGGLIVGQPNPYSVTGQVCTPALLPYPVTFHYWYDKRQPSRETVSHEHFITEDVAVDNLPFPADTIRSIDPRYKALARQTSTRRISLAVCEFGQGRVVIHTGPDGYNSPYPTGDEVFKRMVVWAAGREPDRNRQR